MANFKELIGPDLIALSKSRVQNLKSLFFGKNPWKIASQTDLPEIYPKRPSNQAVGKIALKLLFVILVIE
jgi:hypothetical protein